MNEMFTLVFWATVILPVMFIIICSINESVAATERIAEQEKRLDNFFSILQQFGEKTRWALQQHTLRIWVKDEVSEQLIFQEELTVPELKFLQARAEIVQRRRVKSVVLRKYEQYFYDGSV